MKLKLSLPLAKEIRFCKRIFSSKHCAVPCHQDYKWNGLLNMIIVRGKKTKKFCSSLGPRKTPISLETQKFKFELNVWKFVETISVQFCPMYYKGKAGQSSDSSALLPRKIGVLPDLLDVYSALYPVCSAAQCTPVQPCAALQAALVQPCTALCAVCPVSSCIFFGSRTDKEFKLT